MRIISIILILTLSIISCKNNSEEIPVTSFEAEMEMIKLDSIYSEFQKIEIALYNKSSVYPDKVLEKVDNLLIEHKTDLNITFDLRYLKAEIFYNIGEYNKIGRAS